MATVVVKGRFIGGPLFHPKKTDEDKEAKYGMTLVLDEGEEIKLDALVTEAIQDKWNGKKPSGLQNWVNRVGDDPEFESFEHHYINPKATSTKDGSPVKRPGTFIKRNGAVELIDQESGIIYPGCHVAVEVDVYAYDGDVKKSIKPGISCGLNKVLFLRDGERLSKQTSAEDAFADFESDAAEQDLGF